MYNLLKERIMSVEIRGSVNTYGKFDIPTDLNGFVPIADFYRAHPYELMNTEVNGQIYHVGSGADAARPFNRAVEAFNPEGNKVIFGTKGNDFLMGTSINDTLVGGPGDDFFITTVGKDIILGGDGDVDTVLAPEVNLDDLSFDFDGLSEVFVYHEPSGTEQEWRDVEFLEINGSTHAMTDFFI